VADRVVQDTDNRAKLPNHIFCNTAKKELTKLTKPGFVSFVSSHLAHFEKIEAHFWASLRVALMARASYRPEYTDRRWVLMGLMESFLPTFKHGYKPSAARREAAKAAPGAHPMAFDGLRRLPAA
jgi:hypothetical protein